MDLICQEMIYNEDYADYLINSLDIVEDGSDVAECANPIKDKVYILHTPLESNYMTNLESVPYSFVPNLFGLMDSSNMEVVGVKQIQNAGGYALNGRNVIVGLIDTGIDYTNPLFFDANGNSRVGVLWDQTIRNMDETFTKNERVLEPYYGTVYFQNEVNRALQQENPYDVVLSRDEEGHGTFMAGIATGGRNLLNDFTGIANGAELAVVKLKPAKNYLREFYGISDRAVAYQESDIIYAVEYLIRYARWRKMPISIFIGVGSSNGGHLGQTFLERYLNSLLENAGVMVSAAAGNEGNERLHYAGELEENVEFEQIELNVAEGQNVLTMEVWGNAPATFAIGMLSPQGDWIERIPPRFGKEELISLPIAHSTIYVAYQMAEIYSGDELIFIRMVNPTPGIWKLFVYADEGKQRSFNIWLPLRQFLQPDTYFLQAEPENTITIPGNAQLVMTMTAYNHLNGSIYARAGRGYIGRNQVKPDLAAPGVNITGPGLRKNFVKRTGTSVAAAHSAGILALFLQWNIENPELGVFYASQTKSFFFKSALREPEYEYPNVVWGYGVMNIREAFEQFRVANQSRVISRI